MILFEMLELLFGIVQHPKIVLPMMFLVIVVACLVVFIGGGDDVKPAPLPQSAADVSTSHEVGEFVGSQAKDAGAGFLKGLFKTEAEQ